MTPPAVLAPSVALERLDKLETRIRAMANFTADFGISGMAGRAKLNEFADELATLRASLAPSLTEQLQQKCSDWGTYWRAPDAHGVTLNAEQATELLRDALGVEVEISLAQQGEAVDLEQFRKPVTAWRALAEIGVLVEYMPYHFRKPEDEYSRRVKEADRLLAIIDAKGPRRPALGEGWDGLDNSAALLPATSGGENNVDR